MTGRSLIWIGTGLLAFLMLLALGRCTPGTILSRGDKPRSSDIGDRDSIRDNHRDHQSPQRTVPGTGRQRSGRAR